jgi:hypothetical protein
LLQIFITNTFNHRFAGMVFRDGCLSVELGTVMALCSGKAVGAPLPASISRFLGS